jgi:hypothetical protein
MSHFAKFMEHSKNMRNCFPPQTGERRFGKDRIVYMTRVRSNLSLNSATRVIPGRVSQVNNYQIFQWHSQSQNALMFEKLSVKRSWTISPYLIAFMTFSLDPLCRRCRLRSLRGYLAGWLTQELHDMHDFNFPQEEHYSIVTRQGQGDQAWPNFPPTCMVQRRSLGSLPLNSPWGDCRYFYLWGALKNFHVGAAILESGWARGDSKLTWSKGQAYISLAHLSRGILARPVNPGKRLI